MAKSTTPSKSSKSAKTGVSTDLEADELLALARHDIERGELESGLRKLKQILAGSNPLAEAQSVAGRLYAQLGLFERAQALFQSYLQTNPDSVVERFQMGMTHLDAGQQQEALAIWEQLLHDHPVHPPALFYKGLVLAQAGKVPEAKQSLDILMKSAPADNLYFGRAKELLQAIDAGGRPSMPPEGKSEGAHVLPKDAYKTEH